MTKRVWIETAARTTALVLLGWGHNALAQETTEAPPAPIAEGTAGQLPDIVVTARKTSERLQDAPVAVSTLSGDALEQRGIRDLSEVARLAPSIKFDSDGDVRASISIRGVGQSSDVNAAPGVGLFVDGVYQPSSAQFTVPFFDAERIEILRGPQGTLYGKNTMGGAISIISRDPGDVFAGSYSLERSSGDQTVANVAVDTPITDGLGNRTSVFYRDSDGLQTNQTTGGGASTRNDFAVRSRFVFEPNDTLRSSLSVFYANLQSNPFAYSVTDRGLNDPIDNVRKDNNGFVDSQYRGVNLTNAFDLDGVTITSLTSYDRAHVESLVDGDFTATSGLLAGGISRRGTFAQEVRVTNAEDVTSNFRWLAGAYYDNDDLESSSSSQANLPAPIFTPGFVPLSTAERHETGETFAGFGQATLVLDRFELVAGLRYDHQTRTNDTIGTSAVIGVTIDPLPTPHLVGTVTIVPGEFHAEVISEAWQPKISASYHFTDDVMGYALASRGFRAGGFNAINSTSENRSYQPEFTTTFEAGLKTEMFDRRLRLNAAVFHTSYQDVLLTDSEIGTDGGTNVYSRNGGKARSIGFELEGAYLVTPDLTLSGSYGYLDFQNRQIIAPRTHREVDGFPPHTFNLSADYSHAFSDEFSLGGHLSVAYIGETEVPIAQSGTPPLNIYETRDAHAITDASVDFNFRTFTLSVFGKNVFDEQYYLSYLGDFATPGTGALGLLNRPAEYGVRISGRF